MPAKSSCDLMLIPDAELARLANDLYEEAGMGFHIAEGPSGPLAVQSDGIAIPLYADQRFYDVNDALAGRSIPQTPMLNQITLTPLANRAAALRLLAKLVSLSPLYTGALGAVPLIAKIVLPASTVFYRFISASVDRRFTGTKLMKGTYLTTVLDSSYANSGFAVVGRYALPIPLPACNVFQYALPRGAIIDVGTATPLFGQSGGGVEICVDSCPSATLVGHGILPEY